jgi:hypothetical protein
LGQGLLQSQLVASLEFTFQESAQATYIKNRKEMTRQDNYTEKLDHHEFAPYQAIENFPKIEKALWEKEGAEDIRHLGNWNSSIQQEFSS